MVMPSLKYYSSVMKKKIPSVLWGQLKKSAMKILLIPLSKFEIIKKLKIWAACFQVSEIFLFIMSGVHLWQNSLESIHKIQLTNVGVWAILEASPDRSPREQWSPEVMYIPFLRLGLQYSVCVRSFQDIGDLKFCFIIFISHNFYRLFKMCDLNKPEKRE